MLDGLTSGFDQSGHLRTSEFHSVEVRSFAYGEERRLSAKPASMNWKAIRLELANTSQFPGGSVSRAFLLRLPLREDGSVNEAEIRRNPSLASVRRFWASEPDRVGQIVHANGALVFSYGLDRAACCALPSQPIRLGGQVLVAIPEQGDLPFRVVSVKPLG